MKIPPIVTPDNIDDGMAADIMEHFIFNMSMSTDLDNIQLCLLAAMKRGIAALRIKTDKEEKNERHR